MKVIQVSTNDITGGAARSAYRLHLSLLDEGVDSQMWVRAKESPTSSVVKFRAPPGIRNSLIRELRKWRINLEDRDKQPAEIGANELFSNVLTKYRSQVLRDVPTGDLINLHWLTGFIDVTSFFPRIRRPVIWTLHDMNPFTGGCHFDLGCGRYQQECGFCPLLGGLKSSDYSRKMHRRKRRAYAAIDDSTFCTVTPSKWLSTQVKKSALLGGFENHVIPYGIDLNTFRPRDAGCLRELLCIPAGNRIIVFVADQPANPRKGFDFIREAILQDQIARVTILVVGKSQFLAGSCDERVRYLGTLSNELLLSMVYSLGDVFVIGSRQDNLPNTVIESMACGTPVVGTNAGGIPELIIDGVTGLLSDVDDLSTFRMAIRTLLDDDGVRDAMSTAARKHCQSNFDSKLQAQRYRKLYQHVIERSQIGDRRSVDTTLVEKTSKSPV